MCILADDRSAFISEADTVWSGYTIVNIRSLIPDTSDNDDRPYSSLSPDEVLNTQADLLAVLYTSGSTGVPKGVQITHRMAMNRIMWQWDRLLFRPGDVGCLKTSLLFVDSVVEIFSCLLHPINLVVSRAGITSNIEEFLGFLQRHQITRVVLVASLLHSILCFLSTPSELERFPLRQLELWISNSETLSSSSARQFFVTFPRHKTLCNFYGGTETMADVTFDVFSSIEDVRRKSEDDALSIGRPIWNTIVYLVDDRKQLCSRENTGQLCVSGLNVTNRGYVAEHENEKHFLINSFVDQVEFLNCREVRNHRTLYWTGDYGRIANGRIIYEGRRDSQVTLQFD